MPLKRLSSITWLRIHVLMRLPVCACDHGAVTRRNLLATSFSPGPELELELLNDRAQRRRASVRRSNRLRIRLPQSATLGSWLQTLPSRLWLHLFVALLVPLALLLGNRSDFAIPASAPETLTRSSQLDLAGAIVPLGAMSLDPEAVFSHAEDRVPDSAFAEILALPETRAILSRSAILSPLTFSSAVAGDQVNVRNGPGLIYDVIGTLSGGTPLTIEGSVEDWFAARTADGQQVWVAAELVHDANVARSVVPPASDIPAPPPPKIAVVREEGLSVRDGPGTAYIRLDSLGGGTTIDLLSRYESWFEVRLPSGRIGWVTGEFLNIAEGVIERLEVLTSVPDPNPVLVVTVDGTVNLRGGPGTAYPKQGTAVAGTQLTLIARYEAWLRVRTPDGRTVWVSSDVLPLSAYIARRVPLTRDIPTLPRPQPAVTVAGGSGGNSRGGSAPPLSAAQAGNVVNFAMQFVGTPYVWGGARPGAFDCSGYTQYVYRQFGLNLPHSAAGQYSQRYGTFISKDNLQPGDIVFFANTYKRGISHVGIYIGGGMVAQALAPGTPLSAVSMNSGYWQSKYYGALRPNL
jgi:cell wall-associated NlpC family hydrolase